MPGIFKGNSGAQQPGGFKNFAIEAAPLFASLAAGYSSGRGPYAYMDQGLAAIQQRQKDRRDQEAAAAATAAFKGLMPGGMGGATYGTKGGGVSAPAPVDPNSPDAVANAAMAALGKPPGGSTDWLKYSNSGATRNDPLDPKLVNAMSFLSDMGITMDVISGGQEAAGEGGARTGSTRHDHGGAADVDFYMGGRKLDWNNPNDMPILTQIVQRAKTNGVTGIGAGDDYMGAGRFHVGFGNPGVWGAGGKGANAPDWLTAAYNGAPGGDVTMSAKDGGGLAMGGPMDPMADPYVQQLMTVMAMPGLTPEQQSVVQLQLQSRIDMLSRPQPGAEEEAARARRARDVDLLGYQRGSPEWTQYVVTGQQPTAAKPIEVGGVLLDPVTYQPIFDSRKPDPGYTMVPAAEVAQLGLPPGAYFWRVASLRGNGGWNCSASVMESLRNKRWMWSTEAGRGGRRSMPPLPAPRLELRHQVEEHPPAQRVIGLRVGVAVAEAAGGAADRRIAIQQIVDAGTQRPLLGDRPGSRKVQVVLAGKRAIRGQYLGGQPRRGDGHLVRLAGLRGPPHRVEANRVAAAVVVSELRDGDGLRQLN